MSTLSPINCQQQQQQQKPQSSKSDLLGNHINKKTNAGILLSRRYEQLLHTERHYDCIFHIGDLRIKCHKLILSSASPVFEAMFYGPLCEQQQEIEILDISSKIFKILIEYIYVGAVDFERLTLENTIEMYYGAEKYFLNELINDCLFAITRKLRFSNILPALELSVCMNLNGLLDVCMSFFYRCCITDPQFMAYLKTHYMHVSKDCIKTIIAANKVEQKHLLWFVYEWCQQECNELGLAKTDCALIIDDLELKEPNMACDAAADLMIFAKPQLARCISIERSYYKACRPFVIDYDVHEWHLKLKSNRFISLRGLIMLSRLTPNLNVITTSSGASITTNALHLPLNLDFNAEYKESLRIEISSASNCTMPQIDTTENSNSSSGSSSSSSSSDEDEALSDHDELVNEQQQDAPHAQQIPIEKIISQHIVCKQSTKYNCDLNISWDEGIILSPDIEYKIKLIWDADAYGAEYPCSLQSNVVDGIQFNDANAHNGSPIKGIHFINLV